MPERRTVFVLSVDGRSDDVGLAEALGGVTDLNVIAAGAEESESAVTTLAAALPDALFVLVGDDPEAPELARACRTPRGQLLADPAAELRRVCAFLDVPYDQSLLGPVEAAVRAAGGDSGGGDAVFASEFTESFAALLQQQSASLLVSTYQTNRLVCARADGSTLNTHFREFPKPMGMAVAPGRIALGTRTEIWDLRNMPEAAAQLHPPGRHDACYLPRNRHVTGDIAVHEMAFAGGELWIVATAFSCLATLDAEHSFRPQWTPRFITRLAAEDRCHLNGLAVAGDRPVYVTALGTGDEPGGWRAGRADGGVLIEVATSEAVLGGLSMPHSPRVHRGRLWLLESGRGALCVADPATGQLETVVELPGFTRGLAFLGDTALVGLSQIRESSSFGELPVTRRLRERECGVWMVDLRSGQVTGFLRFTDLVQEVFDVAVLPGARYPEIAEATGRPTESSYALP